MPPRSEPRRWIALIGDLVASRQLRSAARRRAQTRLHAFMQRLDALAGDALAAHFVVTAGDEFQGLLRDATPLAELLWAIQVELAPLAVRVGVGRGTLATPLREGPAIGMDGPAFHAARAAIEAAEEESAGAPVFRGFGPRGDVVLGGLARALHGWRARWTDRQRDVVLRLRAGAAQVDVTRELGISPQAVSKHAAAAGFAVHTAAEDALRAALELVARCADAT
ncbi:MAG: hypothetical protein IPM29_15340 [Planctomycetes bacterium]|nr:hypothetical protein [Planctomycetota bacterium]